jgi:hypothetical protein
MRPYDENDDFNPLTEEELLQRAREEEERRRIRREVLRMQSGEADEDIARDLEMEREQRAEQQREEARKRLKRSRLMWQLFSGNILVSGSVACNYRYFIAIAVMCFVSIAVMFAALYADIRYTRVERELQLVRERSIRLQEQLFSRTTHAAIAKEVEERGLGLQEPRKSREVVDD